MERNIKLIIIENYHDLILDKDIPKNEIVGIEKRELENYVKNQSQK